MISNGTAVIILMTTLAAMGLTGVAIAVIQHSRGERARRQAEQRRREQLAAMSIDELADEARKCAIAAGHRQELYDLPLFQQRGWDRISLAVAIDNLADRLQIMDARSGAVGPAGRLSEYYDYGLAEIRELLRNTGSD
jgi:hypothetical protein